MPARPVRDDPGRADKDACVENDPHVHHDAEAMRAARVAVKDVPRATFKLA